MFGSAKSLSISNVVQLLQARGCAVSETKPMMPNHMAHFDYIENGVKFALVFRGLNGVIDGLSFYVSSKEKIDDDLINKYNCTMTFGKIYRYEDSVFLTQSFLIPVRGFTTDFFERIFELWRFSAVEFGKIVVANAEKEKS